MKYFLSIVLVWSCILSTSAQELCVWDALDTWNHTKTEGNITFNIPGIKKISHEKIIFQEYTRFEPKKIPHTDELLDRLTILLFGKEKSNTRRLALKGKEQNIFLYGGISRLRETLKNPFHI